jgi:hypothetical protein
MFEYQRLTPANWGQNVIVVSDIARGDIVSGTQMAFMKLSDIGYAKVGGMNRWRFGGYVIPILGLGFANINSASGF